ncbi:MAG: glycosyltransferase family 4 protein [Thermoleophilia bacterium]
MLHVGINGRSMFRQMTGVQHYAHEVTRALLALPDDDISFSVFAGREGRSGADTGMPLSTSHFRADSPLKGMLWEQTLLVRMARRAGIDILFSPANVAPLLPGVPSVVTIHDLAFLLFPEYFSRTFALYYRTLIPKVVRQATAVITDSESTRADLESRLGVPGEKITVIPLGVSPAFRRTISRKERDDVRQRYSLPEKYLLSISSLEPRKNLKGVLAAFRLLPGEITREHRLVIVGAGNRVFADPGLGALLRQMPPGSVVTPGYVPDEDLPVIYRMATALVYPSFYEGFGLPVLEAMAASTPVITSNCSSLPEVAGRAAVVVDPDSVEELAAAMTLLTTDSGTRNLLVERGKIRAAGFTWEKTASRTLEVLRAAAR